ncbi:PAS domain S-box protein [Leptospira alstonii]|uniref:histidine kinase n=2 Tax=Leptospira alstonii TaxID=28452 RepID=M6CV92_9LEPT|nr:PAS domain S-box protein [Leptospira alstonii]EMJ94401.1 PAS domain S-box protein [Leptospira alstonii serovar Sichuan str. 79601]EQA82586.1 PAS domain S-box protein [Leptospira alstonii serovar Pingchang str. 80-412]
MKIFDSNLFNSEFFQQIFETSRDAIAIADLEGNFLEVNLAFLTLTGYSSEELRKISFWSLIPEEWIENQKTIIEKYLFPSGYSQEFEKEYIRKDGSIVSMNVKIYVIQDDLKNPISIWGSVRDISEHKRNKNIHQKLYEEVKENREALERLFFLNPLPISITEINTGKLLEVNRKFAQQIDYDFNQLKGKTTVELGIWFSDDDRKKVVSLVRQNGFVDGLELRFLTTKGKEFWVLFSAQLIEYKGKNALLSIPVPITDRILEEKEKQRLLDEVREKEEILSQIFRMNPSAITLAKENGVYIDVNDRFLEYLGKKREDVLSKTPADLADSFYLFDRATILQTLREKGIVQNFEGKLRIFDGTIKTLLFSLRFLESFGEKKILTIGHDITELRESTRYLETLAKELEKSKDLFQKLFQLIPSSVVVTDLETRKIVDVNERFLEMIQLKREDVIGKTTPEIHVWDKAIHLRNEIYEALSHNNEVKNLESVFMAFDGTEIPILYSARIIELDGRKQIISLATDISEKKKAEEERRHLDEELRLSKDLFEKLFQLTPAAVSLSELETGIYRQINQSYCDLIGYTREQVLGKSSSQLGIWKDSLDQEKLEKELEDKGWSGTIEATIQNAGGTLKHVLSGNRVFRLEGKQMLLSLLIDITDKKKAEAERDEYLAKMQESKNLFEMIFEMNPDTITLSEFKTGKYIKVNEHFSEMLQYSKEEAVKSTSLQLGIWQDVQNRDEIAKKLQEEGLVRDYEVQFVKKDGSVVDAVFSARLVNVGNSTTIIAITRDVTLIKNATREKEEQTKRIALHAQALMEMATDFEFATGNLEAGAKKITIMAAEVLHCERVSIWIFDKDDLATSSLIAGWDKRSQAHIETTSMKFSDYPNYFEAIQLDRFVDATDVINDPRTRELAESYCIPLGISSLLDAPFFLRGKMKGIICLEHRGELRKWKGYEKQFVVTIAEQVTQLFLNAERKEVKEELEKAVQVRTSELAHALENLQKTQDQLILSEKMAALGQLMAGIAHEINNPLGAIAALSGELKAYLDSSADRMEKLGSELFQVGSDFVHDLSELIRSGIDSKENALSRENRKGALDEIKRKLVALGYQNAHSLADRLLDSGLPGAVNEFPILFANPTHYLLVKYALEEIQTYKNILSIRLAVDRTSKIVYALKSYAHIDSEEVGGKVKTDLAENIETVLTLYQNKIKASVELELEFSKGLVIEVYPDDLVQVWTNLIYNALQAMRFKGKIKISTLDLGEEVQVSIEDNGPGIPLEVREKIFDPFFTTKGPGEGSGLGLDISRRIVKKHEGRIELESEPGKTIFYVILPKK